MKKKHDLMRKKMDRANREKHESVNQIQSLFQLFTQQRKALEVSIAKNKKYEEEFNKVDFRHKNSEEQQRLLGRKID